MMRWLWVRWVGKNLPNRHVRRCLDQGPAKEGYYQSGKRGGRELGKPTGDLAVYPSVETHYPGLSQAVWVFPSLRQLLCHLLSHPTTDEPQGIHRQQGPNSCSGPSSLLPSTPRAALIIAHSLEGRSLFIRLSQLHKVCLPRTQFRLPSPRPRLPSQSWT